MAKLLHDWNGVTGIEAQSYTCGYCGNAVASNRGWETGVSASQPQKASIYICPLCKQPTYIYAGDQVPGVIYGDEVSNLPDNIASLYREARNCIAARSYTASVLTCRKLLMNIAVAQGATEGKTFLHYVEHLAASGYVPPNGRGWVDHIRKKGNEANHEISLMNKSDAEELILFAEMLLKFVYEFPSRVPAAQPPTSNP